MSFKNDWVSTDKIWAAQIQPLQYFTFVREDGVEIFKIDIKTGLIELNPDIQQYDLVVDIFKAINRLREQYGT